MFCLPIVDCLYDSKSRGGWLNDLGYGRQVHTFYDYIDCGLFLGTKPSIVESIRSLFGFD